MCYPDFVYIQICTFRGVEHCEKYKHTKPILMSIFNANFIKLAKKTYCFCWQTTPLIWLEALL